MMWVRLFILAPASFVFPPQIRSSMSRRMLAHIAALRHQVRRIQRTALFGVVTIVPCAVLLLSTTQIGWLSLVLLFLTAGYVQRKIRRLLWARRSLQQLRLEDQFVRHSPTSVHIRTCTRRFNHLWKNSLTLNGLKTILKDKPSDTSPSEVKHQHIRQHFMRSYEALRPARLPADLIWFTTLGLLWIGLVPATLTHTMTPPMFLGTTLLFLILVAEVLQAILSSDFRGGLGHFVTLLSEWTLIHAFKDLFGATRDKPYRHTRLYHTSFPSLTGLEPLPAPTLDSA